MVLPGEWAEVNQWGEWGEAGAACRPSNARLESVGLLIGSAEPLKVYEGKHGRRFPEMTASPSRSSRGMLPLNLQLIAGAAQPEPRLAS